MGIWLAPLAQRVGAEATTSLTESDGLVFWPRLDASNRPIAKQSEPISTHPKPFEPSAIVAGGKPAIPSSGSDG